MGANPDRAGVGDGVVMFARRSGDRFRSRGLVCLARNQGTGVFDCYWYRGAEEDHLVEQTTCADADAAIGWGRARSVRVRIRDQGQTAWVGAASVQDGIAPRWDASPQRNVRPSARLAQPGRGYRR
jgi:hypothetical protein